MIIKSIKIKLEGNPFYYILRLQGVGVDGSQYRNKSAVALANSSILQRGFGFLISGKEGKARIFQSIELCFTDSKKNLWSVFRTKRCFVIQKNHKKTTLDYPQLIEKLTKIEKVDTQKYGMIDLLNFEKLPKPNHYYFFNIQDISSLKEDSEDLADDNSSFSLHLSKDETEVNSYAKVGYGWGYTGKVAL